jgi:hypothetical protein
VKEFLLLQVNGPASTADTQTIFPCELIVMMIGGSEEREFSEDK